MKPTTEPSKMVLNPPWEYLLHMPKKGTNPADPFVDCEPEATQLHERPFSAELARGAGLLEFRVFDLTVLEHYRHDPRYYYNVTDCDGYIAVHDGDCAGVLQMPEPDKILLRYFGFAYNDKMHRAVAVFLKELAKMPAKHQQIWHPRILPGDYQLHPLFYQTKVLGIWGKYDIVTNAILWELHRINECCAAMGRPLIFRKDYWLGSRPKNFCFLIRPTAKEFAEFCQTLDKMLSDDIDHRFFAGQIPDKIENVRNDGRIEVVQKGTITLLQDWLFSVWKPFDPALVESKLDVFKKVRRLRNPSAHSHVDDRFDQKFLQEQRVLLREVHETVSLLRRIFESDPKVQQCVDKFEQFDCEVLDY